MPNQERINRANELVRSPTFQSQHPTQQLESFRAFLAQEYPDRVSNIDPLQLDLLASNLMQRFQPSTAERVVSSIPVVGPVVQAFGARSSTPILARGLLPEEAEANPAARVAAAAIVEAAFLVPAFKVGGRLGGALVSRLGLRVGVEEAAAAGGADVAANVAANRIFRHQVLERMTTDASIGFVDALTRRVAGGHAEYDPLNPNVEDLLIAPVAGAAFGAAILGGGRALRHLSRERFLQETNTLNAIRQNPNLADELQNATLGAGRFRARFVANGGPGATEDVLFRVAIGEGSEPEKRLVYDFLRRNPVHMGDAFGVHMYRRTVTMPPDWVPPVSPQAGQIIIDPRRLLPGDLIQQGGQVLTPPRQPIQPTTIARAGAEQPPLPAGPLATAVPAQPQPVAPTLGELVQQAPALRGITAQTGVTPVAAGGPLTPQLQRQARGLALARQDVPIGQAPTTQLPLTQIPPSTIPGAAELSTVERLTQQARRFGHVSSAERPIVFDPSVSISGSRLPNEFLLAAGNTPNPTPIKSFTPDSTRVTSPTAYSVPGARDFSNVNVHWNPDSNNYSIVTQEGGLQIIPAQDFEQLVSSGRVIRRFSRLNDAAFNTALQTARASGNADTIVAMESELQRRILAGAEIHHVTYDRLSEAVARGDYPDFPERPRMTRLSESDPHQVTARSRGQVAFRQDTPQGPRYIFCRR